MFRRRVGSTATITMITVQLLGGASLRSGSIPINGPPAQRHRVALLALVVCAWPQPLSRDRAMAMLWPEKDVAAARRLLNLAVHVLRGTLGDGAVVSAGDGLLFSTPGVICDLYELRSAIAARDAERVVQLYAGPLLDGFHLDESTEFGYWLDERRANLAHEYAGALLAIAGRQERAGDIHGRVGTCLRLVSADPHSATHAMALMRALDAAGDRAGARHHAIEHARRLRHDLDAEPDPEVVALAERLRLGAHDRLTSSVAPAPRLPAVAVLPFRHLGAGHEYDWFADGITEDVISQLSKLRSFCVISRAAVVRFEGRRDDRRRIGATLGATTLLDASVRRAGDRVRIVAALVDVDTDRQLWAETYDRQVTDVLSIQSEIALEIATALESALAPRVTPLAGGVARA
jgi:TolB-like protein